MNFQQAIVSGFKKYVQFSGRASRSEFWYWTLFVIIGSGIASLLGAVVNEIMAQMDSMPASLVALAELGQSMVHLGFGIGIILPSMAVTARRLHDINKSGWCWFVCLIPLIGVIVLFVWYCKKGDGGENRFGANPLVNSQVAAGAAI